MPFDREKIKKFPTDPGVYIMKDSKGSFLYIGKAKNLRQRVRQYFVEGGDGRWMIPLLMAKVETIETIVVRSDKEALLVENTLIKQHQPRYNALLKDDKSYVALKVTTQDAWPAVRLVRYKGRPKKDGLYFGPYTSAHGARTTLDVIQKVFPLRQCSDREFAQRTRPCILHQMGRCIAPCVQQCTSEEYQYQVERVVAFLRGKDTEIIQDLYQELERASAALEFEKAGALLQTIRQIEKTVETQYVEKPLGEDIDAWGIYREGEDLVLSQLLFRSGKLIGARPFSLTRVYQEDGELLRSFLLQQYEEMWDYPHEILLPLAIEDREEVGEILSARAERKMRITTPKKGDKKALVALAVQNAQSIFQQERDETVLREKALLDMKEKFCLIQYPEKIECFDNSNFSGSEPVSALVAFCEGLPDKKRYRRFKIQTSDPSDDYGMMEEVLMRRLKRGKEEKTLPDLIVIDGGKGHLRVAERVLHALNIITIDLIAIAKEGGRHDKGISLEQIFLPNRKESIVLKKTSPTLFLLQRIRDEAHRFAISFQKTRRKKALLQSALDHVPTIGPKKRKALLTHFGSVQNIQKATDEEIFSVSGITKKNIEELRKFFCYTNPNK